LEYFPTFTKFPIIPPKIPTIIKIITPKYIMKIILDGSDGMEDIMRPENSNIGKICGALRRKTNKGTYENL